MIETLFNLKHAFERCIREPGNKVWAEDRLKADSKWGKVFLVGTPEEIIERCMEQGKGKLYEIIESRTSCAFHLDIELGRGNQEMKLDPSISAQKLSLLKIPNGKITPLIEEYMDVYKSPITETEMVLGVGVCLKFITTFLNESLGLTLTMDDLKVISGCRTDKFSLHIVCQKVIFDRNVISMATYAFEMCRFFRRELDRSYVKTMSFMNSSNPLRRFYVRALMLHRCSHGWGGVVPLNDTPIDETIYSRNRQFRCVGSGKQGCPILRIVHKRPQFQPLEKVPVEKRLLASDIMCTENHFWKHAVPTPEDFLNSLVGTALRERQKEQVLVVHPSRWFRKHSFDIALYELMGQEYFQNRADCYVEEKRFVPEGWDDDIDDTEEGQRVREKRKQERKQERKERTLSKLAYDTLPNTTERCRVELVEDTEKVFGEFMEQKELREYHSGDVVFHNTCEVVQGENGRVPSGDASGKIIVGDDGSVGLYCFNCNTLCWSVASYNPMKLVFEPHEIINSPYDKINENGRVDIDLDCGNKFVVIDAPPGTGKTELVQNFIKKYPELSVLAITFRVALASYMSWRLGLRDYRDGSWNPKNKMTGRRMAICLDSLAKMRHHTYDIIILDEAGLIRRHITSSTIAKSLVPVYRSLENLLRNAKKVIICQHELSERDVNFYTSQVGVENTDRSRVTRHLFNKSIPIYPILVSNDCGSVVSSMISFYQAGWCTERLQLRIPFIVFCTSAKMCAALTALLKSLGPDEGRERIKGIWGGVQDEIWPRKFLDNPNSCSSEADVVLVTSVLQAGHSLDSHFKCAFWFLFRGILSHPDEVQFVQRLRTLGKVTGPNMNISCAYIQEGLSHKKQASFMEILKRENDLMSNFAEFHSPVSALHSETIADVEALRNDTENRHFLLWKNLYAGLRVRFETLPNPTNPNALAWPPKRCMQWIAEYSLNLSRTTGKCLRKVLGEDQERDIESIEDIMNVLNQTEYNWLDKEQRLYIADTHETMAELFKKGNLRVLAKILPFRDFESTRLNSLFKKLQTLGAYFDYLADMYGPHEEETTRWSARLKQSSFRNDPNCYAATLTVVLAAALFQNLCEYPFPINRVSVQLKPSEIKTMFQRPISGVKGNMTIGTLYEKVFGSTSGKFYNSRNEKSMQYYSMANVLSWVLARCRLRLKPLKYAKRKRVMTVQVEYPEPLTISYPSGFAPINVTGKTSQNGTSITKRSMIDQEVEDIINDPAVHIYDDEPLGDENLENNCTVITDLETSGLKQNVTYHVLDFDYFLETLTALRCLYTEEDFNRWMSVHVLAPYLRQAKECFDNVYMEPGSN